VQAGYDLEYQVMIVDPCDKTRTRFATLGEVYESTAEVKETHTK